ncbi:MAG: hypothetical protein JNL13_06815, partial [Chitinophagaceae bacterium]|nr:hypothetical protein [Chitinophagaceae bacterium]
MRSTIQVKYSAVALLTVFLLSALQLSAQSFRFNAHEKSEKHTASYIKVHHLPDTITVRGDAWYDVRSGSTWKADTKIKSTQDFIRF